MDDIKEFQGEETLPMREEHWQWELEREMEMGSIQNPPFRDRSEDVRKMDDPGCFPRVSVLLIRIIQSHSENEQISLRNSSLNSQEKGRKNFGFKREVYIGQHEFSGDWIPDGIEILCCDVKAIDEFATVPRSRNLLRVRGSCDRESIEEVWILCSSYCAVPCISIFTD